MSANNFIKYNKINYKRRITKSNNNNDNNNDNNFKKRKFEEKKKNDKNNTRTDYVANKRFKNEKNINQNDNAKRNNRYSKGNFKSNYNNANNNNNNNTSINDTDNDAEKTPKIKLKSPDVLLSSLQIKSEAFNYNHLWRSKDTIKVFKKIQLKSFLSKSPASVEIRTIHKRKGQKIKSKITRKKFSFPISSMINLQIIPNHNKKKDNNNNNNNNNNDTNTNTNMAKVKFSMKEKDLKFFEGKGGNNNLTWIEKKCQTFLNSNTETPNANENEKTSSGKDSESELKFVLMIEVTSRVSIEYINAAFAKQ